MEKSAEKPRNNVRDEREKSGESNSVVPVSIQSVIHNNPDLRDLPDLMENDLHLRQIIENIEQVFWLREINSGRILFISPGFERIWGVSRDKMYADPTLLIESVHPEDRLQSFIARPRSGTKPSNQAFRIHRPDGSVRWIFMRSFLINDEKGKPYCFFNIVQDITDQKQVELALRKNLDRTREQFTLSRRMSLTRKPEIVLKTLMSASEMRSALRSALLLFNNPKVGVTKGVEFAASWLSSEVKTPWASEINLYDDPSFLQLFKSRSTVVIPDIKSDPRLLPIIREMLLEGQNNTLAIFPLVASGSWLGCLLVYYPTVHFFEHLELRHLKVLVDQATITLYNIQLLEIEEESRHEAERANEIKGEFLAMISHELRTPLTSIVGFTTTLLAEDVSWQPEEQHDFIQTIQQESNRLQELIDHLLDLSRLEAGRLPIVLKSHSVDEIIQDATPQLITLTANHKLMLDIPPDLPLVQADTKRVTQVLSNLVRNAVTYSPPDTEITISAKPRGNFMEMSVSDQGPGIPHSERKKVFKAFVRGKNEENNASKGAGLGLAICEGLIEAHGGRIWIRKKNSPGMTIAFTIPLVITHTSFEPDPKE